MTIYECEFCETFASAGKTIVQNHENKHKTKKEKPDFICEICNYKTKIKRYLDTHNLSKKHISKLSNTILLPISALTIQ